MSVRGIDVSQAVLAPRPNDQNLPEPGRLVTALRQLGYSLEQALADLIDNSVNASANTILIRFLHDGEHVRAVAVADDGWGMTSVELKEALRFGTIEAPDPSSLGKFGMGLKLASFSHARSLTVYSRQNYRSTARRWTLDSISKGWWCEKLRSPVPAKMLDSRWADLDLTENGTIVLWEDIDKLPSHQSGLHATLSLLERRLRLHLGMCFHRFLESGEIRILIDTCRVDRATQGLPGQINPLNPFAYPESASADYPKTLRCNIAGIGDLEFRAHIWPPKSDAPEYRLGRRASSRQGFYFYRNGRLIQAGGWNGLVQDETEPHSSLARLEVNLPPGLDNAFGINVQKSAVIVPPGFEEAAQRAVDDSGTTFEDYRREAQDVYRSVLPQGGDSLAVPTSGIPRQLTIKYREQLNGAKEILAPVGFKWVRLAEDELFRLNHETAEILLNLDYRSALLGEQRGSSVDVPVLKLLLFFITKRDLEKPSSSARRRKELRQLNTFLAQAAELMRQKSSRNQA